MKFIVVPTKSDHAPKEGMEVGYLWTDQWDDWFTYNRLCCTNRARDSSRESSMVAGMHEQTYTSDLQDQELASL